MSKDYYASTDPYDMETRFSNEDSFAFMESIFSEPSEEDVGIIRQIKDLLAFIPQMEADFMELYFFRQIRQTDIAHMFNVSQPTVCYRLARATVRIRYLLNIIHVTEDELRYDLFKCGLSEKEIEIVVGMLRTTCQSEVAANMGLIQSHVRMKFLTIIRKLNFEHPHMKKYEKTFNLVAKNPNILRDVSKRIPENHIQYIIRP